MARLAAWQDRGFRLIVPGDAEWPTQLDDLGDARPLVLWLHGSADLRLSCVNSVAIVGARAATGYGQHVAIEMAATLAERGVVTVSGGPYGIDARAPRRRPRDATRRSSNSGALWNAAPTSGRAYRRLSLVVLPRSCHRP
jgi:predicted Rossmann fold nucleotide-binding protein DprA/Smf involved in DNA uptake